MLQFHTPRFEHLQPPRALLLCQPGHDGTKDIACLLLGDLYEAREQFCVLCTTILLDSFSCRLLGQVQQQLTDLGCTRQLRLGEFAEDRHG